MVKNLPANAGDTRDEGSILKSGRSPGAGNGNHSSILAGIIPWTEESGGLQSRGGHKELGTTEHTHTHTHTHCPDSCALWGRDSQNEARAVASSDWAGRVSSGPLLTPVGPAGGLISALFLIIINKTSFLISDLPSGSQSRRG